MSTKLVIDCDYDGEEYVTVEPRIRGPFDEVTLTFSVCYKEQTFTVGSSYLDDFIASLQAARDALPELRAAHQKRKAEEKQKG